MRFGLFFAAVGLVAGLASCGSGPAAAQAVGSAVVATCGSASYNTGQTYPNTQDPTGEGCVNATVSASVAVAPLTSTNLSGTISVTNTFQSIQASTAGRKGCTIQNQSATDAIWVFFGAVGSATKATSFLLDPTHGMAISCAVGGLGVLTDQVSITGTATDVFVANFQ